MFHVPYMYTRDTRRNLLIIIPIQNCTCSSTYASSQNPCSGSHSRIGYSTPKTEVSQSLLRLPLPACYRHATNPRPLHPLHPRPRTAEHQANNFILLRSKIRRLPAVHQATLRAIIEHLGRVVMHSEKNKMDAKNLAIVFGGVVFGEDEMPVKAGDLLSVQSYKVSLF